MPTVPFKFDQDSFPSPSYQYLSRLDTRREFYPPKTTPLPGPVQGTLLPSGGPPPRLRPPFPTVDDERDPTGSSPTIPSHPRPQPRPSVPVESRLFRSGDQCLYEVPPSLQLEEVRTSTSTPTPTSPPQVSSCPGSFGLRRTSVSRNLPTRLGPPTVGRGRLEGPGTHDPSEIFPGPPTPVAPLRGMENGTPSPGTATPTSTARRGVVVTLSSITVQIELYVVFPPPCLLRSSGPPDPLPSCDPLGNPNRTSPCHSAPTSFRVSWTCDPEPGTLPSDTGHPQ